MVRRGGVMRAATALRCASYLGDAREEDQIGA